MDRTCFSLLAYADDIVLLGEDEQKVVGLCGRLIESAKKVGLHLNIEKTQYMKVSRELDNLQETETITVGQYEFKRVEDFKYLGTIVTQKNECQIEIQQRIKMGNKCFYALGKLLSSKVMSKEVKTQLYLTIIRPIVMYGSQCWTLRKTEEERLAVFERKVLRKIYGPIYDQELQGWRKRHNQELTELFNRPNIINEIKRSKLEWAGHAVRKQDSMVQRVLQENPKRKRPLGRPRLRWEDGIKKDFLSAGGAEYDHRDWKEVAENREEWERICSMARWSQRP